MTEDKRKWPGARIIHLSGGCRAINNFGPLVEFAPNTLEGKIWQFKIRVYKAVYKSLESLSISIVGVDFYPHGFNVEGFVPWNWRSFHRTKDTPWPTEELSQKWSYIGHAAFDKKNGQLWDIASRISHQLKVCDWRLREISEAYRKQLIERVKANDFKVGQRFEDGFTWLTYLSIQSFLVDACILRDYLAEFAYEFVYKNIVDIGNCKITSMGSLKKKVLNNNIDNDDLTKELRQETSASGWITLLGNYRDIVVHSAPLAQIAEKRLFSLCDKLVIDDNGSLPMIRTPIPENPAQILSSRSTGNHFADFDRQLNVFAEAAKGDIPMIDGLDYASVVLVNLSALSKLEANKSPLAPRMPIIRSSNII